MQFSAINWSHLLEGSVYIHSRTLHGNLLHIKGVVTYDNLKGWPFTRQLTLSSYTERTQQGMHKLPLVCINRACTIEYTVVC